MTANLANVAAASGDSCQRRGKLGAVLAAFETMSGIPIRGSIVFAGLLYMVVLRSIAAERINHEGRILGALPIITNSILFNTPEADAVVSAMQIFPRDNAWNEDISRRPLLGNSLAMMTQVTKRDAEMGWRLTAISY